MKLRTTYTMDSRYLIGNLGHIHLRLILFFTTIATVQFISGTKLLLPKYELDFSIWLVINALFIAPVLEELVFRCWLSLKTEDIRKSVIFCSIGLLYWLNVNQIHLMDYFSFGGLILLYFLSCFYKGKFAQSIYILFSSLLFGIIHLVYIINVEEASYFLIVLTTFPQAICGYYFAKVRLERGILYAMALHFLSNILPVAFVFVRFLFY